MHAPPRAQPAVLIPPGPLHVPSPLRSRSPRPIRIQLTIMKKTLLRLAVVVCTIAPAAYPQTAQSLSVPPDSARWDLEGEAKPVEYQGRKCLLLNGGVAVLKDFELRDGVLDVDVSTPAIRGFFGFDFRIDKDGANYEEVYLRQHKS